MWKYAIFEENSDDIIVRALMAIKFHQNEFYKKITEIDLDKGHNLYDQLHNLYFENGFNNTTLCGKNLLYYNAENFKEDLVNKLDFVCRSLGL